MTNFYVYVHKRKTDGVVFYVGKGSGKRLNRTSKRSNHWKSVVNKHGFVAEIVEDNLQEWYAFELEQNLIAYYGRSDLKLGPLVNHSDGGEGTSGNILSEATKEKIRQKAIGRPGSSGEALRGCKLSEEHKLKIKEGNLRHPRSVAARVRKELEESKPKAKRVVSKETAAKTSVGLKRFYELNGGKPHSYETRRKLALKRNPKIVHLIHESGDVFIGVVFDFTQKYGIDIRPLFKTNPVKTHKGWRRVCP